MKGWNQIIFCSIKNILSSLHCIKIWYDVKQWVFDFNFILMVVLFPHVLAIFLKDFFWVFLKEDLFYFSQK